MTHRQHGPGHDRQRAVRPQNSDVTVDAVGDRQPARRRRRPSTAVDGGPGRPARSVTHPGRPLERRHAHDRSTARPTPRATPRRRRPRTVVIDTTAPPAARRRRPERLFAATYELDRLADRHDIASVEFQYRPVAADRPVDSIGTDTTAAPVARPVVTTRASPTTPTTSRIVDRRAPATRRSRRSPTRPSTTRRRDSAAVTSRTAAPSAQRHRLAFNAVGPRRRSPASAPCDFQVKAVGRERLHHRRDADERLAYHWDSTHRRRTARRDIRVAVTDDARATARPTRRRATVDRRQQRADRLADRPVAPPPAPSPWARPAPPTSRPVSYAIRPQPARHLDDDRLRERTGAVHLRVGLGRARRRHLRRARHRDRRRRQPRAPTRRPITIDNTAPTGTLTQPAAGATVGGPSVALAATARHGGSGVASRRPTSTARPARAAAFTDITGSTWDATAIASGDYDVRREDHRRRRATPRPTPRTP